MTDAGRRPGAGLSRRVSHALRHEPWLYELEPDDEGWVPVDQLVEALCREPGLAGTTVADVQAMVARAAKQRHEIRDGRIRASYGHSLPRRIDFQPGPPPDRLFHGTAEGAVSAIESEGLRPMARQYVHLSVDRATAVAVGGRKARHPVVLVVRASEAARAGTPFYRGNAVTWLADSVEARFLRVDD